MGPHSRERVEVGKPALNLQAFHRVGIIGGPNLRAKAEHPQVKAVTPAGATLQQDLGTGPENPGQYLVKADDITVVKLPLVLQHTRTGLCNVAVHIPLDVTDFRLIQNPADLFNNVIPDLFLTEVKNHLIPGENRLLLRMLHRPFRVFPEEVTVGVNHLRFDPDPEIKTEFSHLIGKGLQPAGELFPVDRVITQAGLVVVTLAKPAIIKDEDIDPQFLAFLSLLEELAL